MRPKIRTGIAANGCLIQGSIQGQACQQIERATAGKESDQQGSPRQRQQAAKEPKVPQGGANLPCMPCLLSKGHGLQLQCLAGGDSHHDRDPLAWMQGHVEHRIPGLRLIRVGASGREYGILCPVAAPRGIEVRPINTCVAQRQHDWALDMVVIDQREADPPGRPRESWIQPRLCGRHEATMITLGQGNDRFERHRGRGVFEYRYIFQQPWAFSRGGPSCRKGHARKQQEAQRSAIQHCTCFASVTHRCSGPEWDR